MVECKEERIFGPPGCGKTTTLSWMIGEAAKRYGSEGVLITSFTKTAAAELAGRGLPVEKEQIGTLHAHCYRALDRPTVAETIMENWNDYAPEFSLTGGGGMNLEEDVVEQQHFDSTGDNLFNQYNLLRNKLVPSEMWPHSVRAFSAKFEAWKKAEGCLDFTDLIMTAHTDVETAPGNPKIIFSDESQDLVPSELQLIRRWGQNAEKLVISADDDQAIYFFKGADPKALLTPIPAENKRVLSQSYRVPRKVQEVAQRLIEKVSVREPKAYNPRDEDGEVRLLNAANWKNPEAAVIDAERYLADGKSVMFLTTCSFMLEPLKQVLKKNAIPFHNPFRKKRGDWNPLTPEKGTSSSQRLLAYLRPDNAAWGSQARMWTPEDVQKWAELVKAKGIFRHGAKGKLDVLAGDEEMSIDTLMQYFEEEALMQALETDLDWLEANLLSTKQKPMEFPLLVARTRGAQALREKPRVILGTGHSVKGGEADVTYVFPDLSIAAKEEWEMSRDAKDAIIRLFYVMFTRSRETLVLCGPGTPHHVKLGGLLK